jgi:hypothetical protein
MIKTIIIPKNNDIHLFIPNNYIGKEIEILVYAKEELLQQENLKSNNAARYKGLLTNEEADKFDIYLNEARLEWKRDI